MALTSARSTGLDQADKIIHGGTVATIDDSNPSAEAIRVIGRHDPGAILNSAGRMDY